MNTPVVDADKYTLCDLLQEVAGIKEDDLSLETYKKLIQKLNVPQGLIDQHVHFSDEGYARNLICVTPRFEMIVMCWQPGQMSSIHDHLDSFALSYVVKGYLTNIVYERTDDEEKADPEYAELAPVSMEVLPAGSWISLDCDGIHKMGCSAESPEPLITLHYYARPLREIHYYYPEEKRRELKRLVYSLLHF
jgi:cysteine dioxygenase